MSIILSGLIHLFRPLLTSLSGAIECDGLSPWYFLLGLRIVAIFFSNGPWDSVKEDVTCNWIQPMPERSLGFCTTLCHNQHFPISVSATWGFVFIVCLLLVGLMNLTKPRKKKEKEKEEKHDKERLDIVATVPRSAMADLSTIYTVGPRGITGENGCYDRNNVHCPHHHTYRAGWPESCMDGGYCIPAACDPSEVGGYGVPVYPGNIGQTKIPGHCYNVPQDQMDMCPLDSRKTKLAAHCTSGTDHYEMDVFHSPSKQRHATSYCGETKQYKMPLKCAPAPASSSSHKGNTPPQCWLDEEHTEARQQRHMAPQGHGICESTGLSSRSMGGPLRYIGQTKIATKYCEDGKYTMATKCRPVVESNMDSKGSTWPSNASMAIKRRPGHGNNMPTKGHVAFEDPARSNTGFGSNASTQPWLAQDSNMSVYCLPMRGKKSTSGTNMATGPTLGCHGNEMCTCSGTNPCHENPQPQCGPSCSGGSSHHRHAVDASPGPQDEAKMSIARLCGVPLFDVWVALLLATEICFLCSVVILQIPTLLGRIWVCTPGAVACPPSVECAVMGRVEKRVALWGLAFTACLTIIACIAYFHLRICGHRRCFQCCHDNDERVEVHHVEAEPEERILRGDVESGNEEARRDGRERCESLAV